MKGHFTIDGVDAYTAYGVYLTEGSLPELLSYPPLKAVESNDWQEEDGIEADLSSPVLDTRDVYLSFAFVGLRIDSFMAALSDKGYHSFVFSEVGRGLKLRLVSAGNLELCGNLRLVSMTFADDFPLDGYVYAAPSGGTDDDGYEVDGMPLSDYGVKVLEGTRAQLEVPPAVKTAMLRNISVVPGAIYDGEAPVRFKSRDCYLYCLMRAKTQEAFWQNHDALLYDLAKPGERVLTAKTSDKVFMCHYKSMTVQDLSLSDGVWMKFTLILTIIQTKRIESCFATGEWIDSGIWRWEDIWKGSPDAA